MAPGFEYLSLGKFSLREDTPSWRGRFEQPFLHFYTVPLGLVDFFKIAFLDLSKFPGVRVEEFLESLVLTTFVLFSRKKF